MPPKIIKIIYFFCILWATTACNNQIVFSENTDMPDAKWFIKHELVYRFEIIDITIPYNVYYNLRNNNVYPYYNLYTVRTLSNASGKILNTRLDEMTLSDPVTGKPTGNGIGDMYDHKLLAIGNLKFPKAGFYQFKIKQYMRQDPLPDVVSVGLTVEKANP